ncbi:MAG: hypothetical protein M3279_04915 [Actinomycetota bacterium]|nr:hypothetical protein [Actinomycetota bacterium]
MEARSTRAGLLAGLPVPWGVPPDDAPRYEGIFSLVVDDPDKKTRALPTMYHGNAQLYADRDVENVQGRLVRTIDAVLHAQERPAYLASACRIDGRPGLYVHGVYNREPYRLRAIRAGLEVADDPYVRLTPAGELECEGWEPFRPEFIVVSRVRGPRGREHENVNRGGLLAFNFGILRVGDMGMMELHHLISIIKDARVVAEEDPERMVETLRAAAPAS